MLVSSFSSLGPPPSGLTALRDILLFSGSDRRLWRSDGTAAGTTAVAGSPLTAYPAVIAAFRDAVLLAGDDGQRGVELWRSDGTPADSSLVREIAPGAQSSLPRDFTPAERRMFFTAVDGNVGRELWTTDGTPSGTVLVKDIKPGSANSWPGSLVAGRGTLFFSADDGTSGPELWRSDGAAIGTTLVADIRPGPVGSQPTGLTAVGETLFFVADDGSRGRELWRSDGTAAGTMLVADIAVGSGSSSLLGLEAVGTRRLLFWADDGGTGLEPWISDGTAPGTTLVADINAGMPASITWGWGGQVPAFTLSAGRVLFAADDGVHGSEPWILDPGATAQVVGAGCGAGRAPSLRATDPVIGQAAQIEGADAPAGAAGFLLLGAPAPGLALPGSPCFAYVSPLGMSVVATFAVGATSTWSTSLFVPNAPALRGVGVALQAVMGFTAMPLGIDVTNGVRWTLGG